MPPRPPPTHHYFSGIMAVVVASVLSSIGWILQGEAIRYISPIAVVSTSLACGGFILLAFATRMSGRALLPALRSLDRGFVAFSLVRSGINSLIFASALTLTSSTKAMFLTKLEPYAVLLVQFLLYGVKTSRGHVALLIVHVWGAVLLSTGGHLEFSTDVRGDLLLIVGILSNALLYGPAQRYARSVGALYTSALSQLIGAALLLPFALITSHSDFALTPELRHAWGYALATVLCYYVLSTALWYFALKEVPAWLASALRCVGPVFAAPLAFLVFGTRLTLIQTTGAAVVILTSMGMVLLDRKAAEPARAH